MLNTVIKDSEWKPIDDELIEEKVPYWCKMTNGNIVLAAYIVTDNTKGFGEVTFDENNKLIINGSTFYMLKGAMVQPALLN